MKNTCLPFALSAFIIASVASGLSGCGGGGSGGESSTTDQAKTAAPFQVADFALGSFSVTGDMVLKPPYLGNTNNEFCTVSGNSATVDASLGAFDGNCIPNMSGGTYLPVQSWTGDIFNGNPLHLLGKATAGQSINVDMAGFGSVLSNLKSGESYGSAVKYGWAEFAQPGTTTKLDFSYKKASPVAQTGLVASTQTKIDVEVTFFWYDSFGKLQSVAYPVLAKQYDGDFTELVTVNFDPKTYNSSVIPSDIELNVSIRHLAKFTRTN